MGKEAIKHPEKNLSHPDDCLRGKGLRKRRVAVKARYVIDLKEGKMAEKQDMRAAQDSYAGFIKMFKWGTVLSVAAAAIVVLIIA